MIVLKGDITVVVDLHKTGIIAKFAHQEVIILIRTMKKLLIFAAVLVALTYTGGCSCSEKGHENGADTIDTIALEPAVEIGPEMTAVGEAYDGADRSIIIVTNDGDTLSFDLPEMEGGSKQSWRIGDTVTVKYVKVRIGDTEEDSVISLFRGRH